MSDIVMNFFWLPLALQLHFVMMSKYSKFGVDALNTFWLMDYIKGFALRTFRSSDHNSLTFFFETVKLIIYQIYCSGIQPLTFDFVASAMYTYMDIKVLWILLHSTTDCINNIKIKVSHKECRQFFIFSSKNKTLTRALHTISTLVCQGPSF